MPHTSQIMVKLSPDDDRSYDAEDLPTICCIVYKYLLSMVTGFRVVILGRSLLLLCLDLLWLRARLPNLLILLL